MTNKICTYCQVHIRIKYVFNCNNVTEKWKSDSKKHEITKTWAMINVTEIRSEGEREKRKICLVCPSTNNLSIATVIVTQRIDMTKNFMLFVRYDSSPGEKERRCTLVLRNRYVDIVALPSNVSAFRERLCFEEFVRCKMYMFCASHTLTPRTIHTNTRSVN